ncbi:hypothetical protein K7432_007513 [Basidiobolus ranarum]|uniref:Short-chain dehydrogenase n=1 Tax=Basidiobolus ranarum TaxID=34480 RepID=A0ABR2WTB7_9FUNG
MPHKFNDETTAEEAASFFASEIKGKTVLVTGATWGGLGAEFARVIAKYGAGLVIVGGRKQESLDDTIKKIKEETPEANLYPLIIDLASLTSIRQAAKEVSKLPEPIDILVNNAAIVASPYSTTADGFEAHFGTNHLGPFLFTNLILPRVLASKTGDPRVVNISSEEHHCSPIRWKDVGFNAGKDYEKWQAYGQSKTANILFALELSNRYKVKGLNAFSLHPGTIETNLINHFGLEEEMKTMVDPAGKPLVSYKWKTIPQGTSTHIVAAFDPSIKDQSGSYLEDAQVNNAAANKYALDEANARELWSLSERLIGQQFDSISQ